MTAESPYTTWCCANLDRAALAKVLAQLTTISARQRPWIALALLPGGQADLYLAERHVNGLPTITSWRLFRQLQATPTPLPSQMPIWLVGRAIRSWTRTCA